MPRRTDTAALFHMGMLIPYRHTRATLVPLILERCTMSIMDHTHIQPAPGVPSTLSRLIPLTVFRRQGLNTLDTSTRTTRLPSR